MRISEEMLMAYVDGELDESASASVEQAMREDPDTAAAVAQARALRARLQRAFAPILDEPVPAHLLAAAEATAAAADAAGSKVVAIESGRRQPAVATGQWRLPQWAAVAAALVLGVTMAPWLRPEAPAMLETSRGALVAGSPLADVLDTRLAADPPRGDVAVGLSFRDRDGRYCRTFALPAQSLAGLACREGDAWRVSALGEARPDPAQLRRAGAALPPAIMAEVDARLQGEPLDRAGEQAARARGWRQAQSP